MRAKASVVAVVLSLTSQLVHAQPGSTATPANTADVQMAVEMPVMQMVFSKQFR